MFGINLSGFIKVNVTIQREQIVNSLLCSNMLKTEASLEFSNILKVNCLLHTAMPLYKERQREMSEICVAM